MRRVMIHHAELFTHKHCGLNQNGKQTPQTYSHKKKEKHTDPKIRRAHAKKSTQHETLEIQIVPILFGSFSINTAMIEPKKDFSC